MMVCKRLHYSITLFWISDKSNGEKRYPLSETNFYAFGIWNIRTEFHTPLQKEIRRHLTDFSRHMFFLFLISYLSVIIPDL